MKKYGLLQLIALLLGTAQLPVMAACNLTEKQLIGSWSQEGTQGYFEDMAFEYDGKTRSFSSWIHHRPEIMGATWTLKGCRLSILNQDNKSLSFTFSAALNRGILELRDDIDAVTAKYQRVR